MFSNVVLCTQIWEKRRRRNSIIIRRVLSAFIIHYNFHYWFVHAMIIAYSTLKTTYRHIFDMRLMLYWFALFKTIFIEAVACMVFSLQWFLFFLLPILLLLLLIYPEFYIICLNWEIFSQWKYFWYWPRLL